MAGRVVTAPTGERWRVRREWMPRYKGERVGSRIGRRFRFSGRVLDAGDGAGCALDVADGIIGAIALVVLAVILVVFIVPVLVAALELVLVLLLVGIGFIAKVVFRRPWGVEAEALDGPRAGRLVLWRVVGWRASGAHRAQVAGALAAGHDLPPGGIEGQARAASAS